MRRVIWKIAQRWKLFKRAATLKGRPREKPVSVATNVGKNAARSRARRIPPARYDQGAEVEVIDEKTNSVKTHEMSDRLAHEVERLPDPLPTLIQLHYQEGLTIREAAIVLGMSEGAARVALHRARKTLRTILRTEHT